jgi:group I intron endonuclease
MREQGIYFIRCTESRKTYVGSSVNMHRRLESHIRALRKGCHGSPILQRSWNKYGEQSFETGVLELVPDRENLLSREQYWIDTSNSDFNVARVAGRVTGWRATDEQRQRASERAIKMWSDPVFRERTSGQIRKGWQNEESREIVSARSKKMFSAPGYREEHGRKIREALSSPEARSARSEQRRLDWADPEKRARLLEGRRVARLRRLGLIQPDHKEQ